jgi:hypothetical protein
MGSAIGGQSGMVIAFAIACVMNFFSYWYLTKLSSTMRGKSPQHHCPFNSSLEMPL